MSRRDGGSENRVVKIRPGHGASSAWAIRGRRLQITLRLFQVSYSAVHCRRGMPPVTPGVALVNSGIGAKRWPVEFLPWIRSSLNLPAVSVSSTVPD